VGKWILLNGYQIEILFLKSVYVYICLSETKKFNIIYAGIDQLNSAVCLLKRKWS
jgi:hypothetical protein